MAAKPLPKRTAANDKVIASTPYDKLTQRQKDYAAAHGVPLQRPPSSAPSATPVTPAGGAQYDNVLSRTQGFDSLQAASKAGVSFSASPVDPNFNSGYIIDGHMQYTTGPQQEAGGPGLNGARQSLLASLSDPYLNAGAKQAALDAFNSGGLDNYNFGGANGGVTASSLAQANGVPADGGVNSAANGQAASGVAMTEAQKSAGD